MALPRGQLEDQPRALSEEEGKVFFNEQAHRMLGISGEEFLRRYDQGEYDEVPDTREGWPAMRLIMLIPFARPVQEFR